MVTADTLAPINQLGRLYEVGIRDGKSAAEGAVDAVELTDPESAALAWLVASHAERRGIAVNRDAGSLAFQRYAHRVARVGLGAMVTGVEGLDLSAPAVSVVVRDGMASKVLLDAAAPAPAAGDEALFRAATDDHLALVASAVHERFGTTMTNLWGNIAAAWAMAGRHLAGRFPPTEVRARIEPLMLAHSRVARGGSFLLINTDSGRERLFYERTTCCQLFTVRQGVYCSWCKHLTHDERLTRFRAGGTHSGD